MKIKNIAIIFFIFSMSAIFFMPAKADQNVQYDHSIQLPILYKNYSSKTLFVIDYVPPISLPLQGPGSPGAPYTLRAHFVNLGTINNPDGTPKYIVDFYYYYNDQGGWTHDIGSFPRADGSVNFFLVGAEVKAKAIRLYLIKLNGSFILPPLDRNVTLPPDPPTEDILLMIEIQRNWPDQSIITIEKP